jgi:type IV secretory pathway TraG/TraD family ATPase VirD4
VLPRPTTPYILAIAGTTNHLVIVHNPSAPAESTRFNVAEGIQTVIDAKAIAAVLLSSAKDDFWSNAGQNLLAGCLLHYPSIGVMMEARRDAKAMARELKNSGKPGVADLTSDFYTSILSNEPKLAMNIMATVFNQALAAWADEEVCRVTATSQFDATTLEIQPTVLILRSSRKHQDALGKYLGAVLRVFHHPGRFRGAAAGRDATDPRRPDPGRVPVPGPPRQAWCATSTWCGNDASVS